MQSLSRGLQRRDALGHSLDIDSGEFQGSVILPGVYSASRSLGGMKSSILGRALTSTITKRFS